MFKRDHIIGACEAVGVPLNIIAALMISISGETTNFVLAYTIFLVASVFLTTSCYLRKANWLVLLNGTFFCINVLGLVRSLI